MWRRYRSRRRSILGLAADRDPDDGRGGLTLEVGPAVIRDVLLVVHDDGTIDLDHPLVAERGGELLGLAHYLFHRSTTAIGPNCYMQDLFTVPAARGTGVGRALIARVAELARQAGAARLYWQTHETNATAMKLYDAVARCKHDLVVFGGHDAAASSHP